MGILEFTNASDLYCRHGGLTCSGIASYQDWKAERDAACSK
jgi:hypothetical protein